MEIENSVEPLPASKTFIWGMFGEDPIKTFERFSKLSLVKGKHVTILLSELVQEYIQKNDIPATLVDERQLVEKLLENGISIHRITLKNYRTKKKLVDSDNNPLWFTDGRNVCYHLEGCLEFFKKRKSEAIDRTRRSDVA